MRKLAQVVARPEKLVAFGDNDPRAIVVEAKVPGDRQRYFDSGGGIGRRAVRDRQHGDDGGAVRFALDGQDDDARPVLLSLFASGLMFAVPEIGIGDDEARAPGWGSA